MGIKKFSIPTAGNAGGALSAYAAKAGLESYVFMPNDAPLANKIEVQYFGAKLELIDGYINYQDSLLILLFNFIGLFLTIRLLNTESKRLPFLL